MKLKTYSKYKSSWIDWIGEIPEGWEVRKIKHFSNTVAWWTPSTAIEKYWEWNIPWLPSWLVHDNIIKEESIFKFITFEALLNSSTKWIKPNSVLIALTWATCWNIWYINFRTTANQSVIWMEVNKNMDSIFLYYYLLTQKEQILINQTWWAQWWINQENVKDIFCSIPPLQTQQKISSFLDSKTLQIEKLIEKDKKLIGLLKERRVSLINKAVTKGLDDNVKMKNSGVEWIGEIPEGWWIGKLKHHAFITRWAILRPVDEPLYYDENWKWTYLNISDVSNCWRYLYEWELVLSLLWSTKSARIKKDNLILTASATIWIPFINKIDVCIHDWFIAFRNIKLDILFLYYFLLNKELYNAIWKSNTQKNIYLDEVKDINITFPPLNEQKKIVDFLDRETEKIDSHVKKVEERIKLYEEYKKSLIYNVVTGKVEV